MSEPWKTVQPHDSRGFTCAVMELVEDGSFDKDSLIRDLLMWMSEGDVREFCERVLVDDDGPLIAVAEYE